MILRCLIGTALLAALCLGSMPGQSCFAQQVDGAPIDVTKPRETTVELEILTAPEGVGLSAQRWRQALEPLGVTFRIRSARFDEHPEVKEQMIGRWRRVLVIAAIDRDGRLLINDKSFAVGDIAAIREWIGDLKTYGAQGSPDGKPLWGLTEGQFNNLLTALSAPVDSDLAGLPLPDAVARLKIPETYAPRITVAARNPFESAVTLPQSSHLRGLSTGTALAILLNDAGLAFRPERTPTGRIDLVLQPRLADGEVWPIGWPTKGQRATLAPKLFTLVTIELEPIPFAEVVESIPLVADVPVFVDSPAIADRQLDLSTTEVTYPRRKTSWSLTLRHLSNQLRLTRQFWVDETGRPFVWITSLDPRSRRDPSAE